MHDALTATTFLAPVEGDTEAALVEAAKTDSFAFGELYERYYTRIYRYCFHRVGTVADAEDLTALVFMKALEALPSYQSRRGGFAPWIFRITRNAVIDYYRRRRQHAPLERVDWEASGTGDPATDVLAVERRQDLQRQVRALSEEQREVILMRYAADLTFPEIAAVLNKNEPAIRMLLHRGLRKLKSVIDSE
jgi:RNA polymerase sigma-70 factor (ECF subfamily)